MPSIWEGNHWSGITVAMCHRVSGEREGVLLSTTEEHKSKTQQQQLRGRLPERLISQSQLATHCHTHQLQFLRQSGASVHSARNRVALSSITVAQQI